MFAMSVPSSGDGGMPCGSRTCARLPTRGECPRTLADTRLRTDYIEAADAFLDALAAFLAARLSALAFAAALAEASPLGDSVWPAAAGAPLPPPCAKAMETEATSNRETRAD